MAMFHFVYRFFDKLEDKVRGRLSHWPIVYAFVAGIGIVLFWRGVWHTADWISQILIGWQTGNITVDLATLPDGPISFLLGSMMLLMTGVHVSSFIGNEIIISGLRGEKKLTEKTETEVRTETGVLADIKAETRAIAKRVEAIEKKLDSKNT